MQTAEQIYKELVQAGERNKADGKQPNVCNATCHCDILCMIMHCHWATIFSVRADTISTVKNTPCAVTHNMC